MRSVCDPREERDGGTKGAACHPPAGIRGRGDASTTCSCQTHHTVSSERQAEALRGAALRPGLLEGPFPEEKGTSLPRSCPPPHPTPPGLL